MPARKSASAVSPKTRSSSCYRAYYELHEIPWKLQDPIMLTSQPGGLQVHIGQGPFPVPSMASPVAVTRAGGALITFKNEDLVLEGHTYFGVAIPLDKEDANLIQQPTGTRWDELAEFADDMASVLHISSLVLPCVNHGNGGCGIASAPNITWTGKSGKEYTYQVYSITATHKAVPANYIFTKRDANNLHTTIYVGETGDLSDRFDSHHKWQCITNAGATHVCTHESSSTKSVRTAEESDILANYAFPCND